MNLLDATATLIDCAKTHADRDRVVMKAVRRMEQRLDLLKLRAAKARRSRRHKAWVTLQHLKPVCDCAHEFTFGELVRTAEIDGRGWIKHFDCPECGVVAVRLEKVLGCYRYAE